MKKSLKAIAVVIWLIGLVSVIGPEARQELGIVSVAKASGTGGGPIVLDGMDPVCHSGGEGTWGYIGQVLKKVYDGSSIPNNAKIAILGSRDTTNSCGGNWNTLMTTKYLNQFSTQPSFDFYTTDASITSFFSSLGSSSSSTPKMIWIPDNWARSSSTEAIFTSNAEKIADFVNSGGGLFANMGSYGWLTALLPGAVFNNGGCNGGPDATADGTADFGLTNTMVAACWHGYFTGNVGTLKTLVDYPYPSSSSPRVAVSIGGGSVSLPSSFTLAISPANPSAGTPLTITATAQTIAGVPQAGVVVSMTVSSGPDAGQTFTATTDASGIAIITVNTSSTGTNVYTATATVNGVVKTVSTTVTWSPAPTTTAAPTTTVEVTTTIPEVTSTVPQTSTPTTSIVVPPAPQTSTTNTVEQTTTVPAETTTTVHDHSTHSHGPSLPATGGNYSGVIMYILGSIALGLIFTRSGRRTKKK